MRSSTSELGHRVPDRERGPHRTLGIVLVHDRRAEDGDDRVADELLHRAAETLELRTQPCVVRSEHRADVLGIQPLGPCGRADEVGEDDRNDLPLLAGLCRAGERRPAFRAKNGVVNALATAVRAGDHPLSLRG